MMKNTAIISKIEELAEQSEGLWFDCTVNADTADRRIRAERAEMDSADLWGQALDALRHGDRESAREALRQAADLARKWGDDASERAALKLLG